jgi:precorrin-8X/cobalt-precorrin-8 methylmutase
MNLKGLVGLSILRPKIGLVLIGHGSELSAYKETVEKLAEIIRRRSPFLIVKTGFMELNIPSIDDAISSAIQEGAEKIIVVPVLLAESRHTMQDIPRLLGMKNGQCQGTLFFKGRGEVQVAYGAPIGADSRLAEIILDRATTASRNLGLVAQVEARNDTGTEILENSLTIVRQLLAKDFESMDPNTIPIVERVVHATADPKFAQLLMFSKGVVEIGIEALKDGADVIADVKMVESGINAQVIRRLGGRVLTYTEDDRAIRLAETAKITRTAAGMRVAAEDGLDDDIVVIGNSPTATLTIVDILKQKLAKPALVIATPVGFVKAAESKEEVSKLSVPCITTRGIKGGSAVAVAVMNALLMMTH